MILIRLIKNNFLVKQKSFLVINKVDIPYKHISNEGHHLFHVLQLFTEFNVFILCVTLTLSFLTLSIVCLSDIIYVECPTLDSNLLMENLVLCSYQYLILGQQ